MGTMKNNQKSIKVYWQQHIKKDDYTFFSNLIDDILVKSERNKVVGRFEREVRAIAEDKAIKLFVKLCQQKDTDEEILTDLIDEISNEKLSLIYKEHELPLSIMKLILNKLDSESIIKMLESGITNDICFNHNFYTILPDKIGQAKMVELINSDILPINCVNYLDSSHTLKVNFTEEKTRKLSQNETIFEWRNNPFTRILTSVEAIKNVPDKSLTMILENFFSNKHLENWAAFDLDLDDIKYILDHKIHLLFEFIPKILRVLSLLNEPWDGDEVGWEFLKKFGDNFEKIISEHFTSGMAYLNYIADLDVSGVSDIINNLIGTLDKFVADNKEYFSKFSWLMKVYPKVNENNQKLDVFYIPFIYQGIFVMLDDGPLLPYYLENSKNPDFLIKKIDKMLKSGEIPIEPKVGKTEKVKDAENIGKIGDKNDIL